MLASVLKESGDKGPPQAIVKQLVRMATATHHEKANVVLFNAAATPKDGTFARWQYEAVAGYYDSRFNFPSN